MMSSEFLQDGLRYIPSRAAAKGAGLSADYISRLCREGQVAGTWHRGAWYVHEPSLAAFVEEKRKRQEELTRAQAEKLRREREQAEASARKATTIAKWRMRARPIALATITLLLATSATAFARPAYEHIAPQLPSDAKAQLASVATSFTTLRNIASNIASSITETIGNFLAPVQQSPTPIVFVPKTATSSPTLITQSNSQPPSQANQPSRVIERVVESVRTLVSGGISEALLDARLAGLDKNLSARINQVALAGAYQTNRTYDVLARTSRVEDPANVTLDVDAGDISGVVDIVQGGTGTSTSPTYGQVLLGNSLGTYDLVATSSLGIVAGGGGEPAFGQTWEIANDALAPTTTLGIVVSASSTFAGGLSATHATVTNATSTSLFASLARFTTGIIDALTAAAATITNLTATTLTAQNASTTVASAYDGVFVGRTATTTIRGNATSTFAGGIETTALDVTGATSTFANGIQLAGGCFLDANGSCITSGGAGAAWGAITGTLSDQSDLQSALDTKFSLTDWYATTTDALAEGATNRYYADARVQTYLDGVDKGFFFATTSADYWQSQHNFFSTTSADYYVSVTDLFSTTSAQYFAHSSTTIPKTYTANVYTALQTFDNASTTNLSASYASSTEGFFGSLSVGNLTGFLKATAGAIATAAIDLATDVTGILGVTRGGTGWASIASAAIPYGNGTSALATTSAGTNGQVLALLNGVPTWAATTTFSSPLVYASGNVTLDTSGNWSGIFDGQEASYYLNAQNLANFGVPFYSFFSATTTSALAEGTNLYWTNTRFDTRLSATTSLPNLTTLANLSITESQISDLAHYTDADTQGFIHASTTIPKTYTSNIFTDSNTFSSLTLGSLNGPLHANAGMLSATTSIGVLYGGTGLTTAPTYGQLLVGNSSGGYTLTATSSLGLATFGYLFPSSATTTTLTFSNGLLSLASTTIGNGTQAGGLTISGGATTTGFLVVQGAATSTFAGGINITSGCYAVNGTCITDSGGGEAAGAGLSNVQVFTSSGTYTPTAGTTNVVVYATGAGGGGGGADGTDSDMAAGAAGGGAGATSFALFSAATIGASQTVTIGTPGAGGSTSGGNGSAGGDTTFGSLLTAGGGTGGTGIQTGALQTTVSPGGLGGASTGGDLNIAGGEGGPGVAIDGSGVDPSAHGGYGGASYWGGGASGVIGRETSTNRITGRSGSAFGSGGGGAIAIDTTTGAAGGAGAAGVVVIYEYSSGAGGGADLAEFYPTQEDVAAADIVALSDELLTYQDASGNDAAIAVLKKAASTDEPLGIVSTAPGLQIGKEITEFANQFQPVALAGRVPVKVSPEAGDIRVGDRITVASTPGVGKRAGLLDASVGIAFEPYRANSGTSTVLVFVKTERSLVATPLLPISTDENATSAPQLEAGIFFKSLFTHLATWLADTTNGITKIVTDILAAKRVETTELCVGSVCVTEADFMATFGAAAPAPPPTSVPSSPSNISAPPATTTPPELTNSEQPPHENSSPSESPETADANGSPSPDTVADGQPPAPAEPTDDTNSPAPANDNPAPPSAEAI